MDTQIEASKNEPMAVRVVTAKWFSAGYTPSFHYCPACDKTVGWKDKEDKVCYNCGQKLK